ncbi:MAG: Gfo/Idh/MocA family oxidoreductase [Candidatus Hydrogenedentes bacterium]|nr:Gfo/Idh/MocA family oxidoreductase [Candidatus Hydrogenedentota bacterium]
MDTVRIGIIGVGGMGSSHGSYLEKGEVEGCKLTAICDIDPARLALFEGVQKFSDSKELIRSGACDAVLIATPHYDHTTIGIDAFEQGLHVLVEKPISVHKADCERLIAAYRKAKDRVFSAMFQQRTKPVFKRIKRLLERGELGEIRRTNWAVTAWFRTQAYYDSGGWRATWKGEGGGVLLNQCPHNLDMFQWLCGVPSRVTATCQFGRYHTIEVEDDVTAVFQYPNGATGVFIASTGEAPGTDRLEIVGDRGRLVLEHGKIAFARTEVSVAEFTRTSPEGFGKPDFWNVEVPVKDAPQGHSVVTQNFVNAILKGEPLIAPAEEGIHSVEIANAMLFSAMLGQPVDIPLDGAAYEAELNKRIAESTFEKKVVAKADEDMNASFR